MFVTLRRMSLPLLIKELQEQAARRRTYLIRVVYVSLMTYLAFTTIALQLQTSTPLNILGQGTPILTGLVNWQFWGIFLLLPGMACGVLTTEKERNTLALLFLTRLGPWTIILEKLLSRLFPMLMFLMCGLPIMAFTYSLGGLTLFQLFVATYFLVLSLFLTGCVAVMCSALCHSTVGAFIQTYFVLLISSIAPHLFYFFIHRALLNELLQILSRSADYSGLTRASGQQLTYYEFGVHPWMVTQVFSLSSLFASFNAPMIVPLQPPWLLSIYFGIPSILLGSACLCVARWALYRRAFVMPSNPLLKFFRGIDKIFFWANRKVPFDVKLVREADSLPDDEPIAWREVSKRSLGQLRYLVRIMIPLMFPVLFVGAMIATSSYGDFRASGSGGLAGMIWFLWVVSLVLITITAANTIPLERARQTWDVLRATPLTGRDILTQKLRGVRRLQWVCSIPVFSAIGLQAWLRYQSHTFNDSTGTGLGLADSHFLWWEYLVGALGSVVIYSELVKWIALWCGLMFRNSMRAVLMSVLAVAAISFLPQFASLLLAYLPLHFLSGDWTAVLIVSAVRTMNVWIFIAANEVGDLRKFFSIPLVPALINLAAYSGMLWLIHRHLMHRADWYLGRIGVPGATRIQHVTGLESLAGEIPHSVPDRTGESSSGIVTAATSGEST